MTLLYPNLERQGHAMTHLTTRPRRSRAWSLLAAFVMLISTVIIAPSAQAATTCSTTTLRAGASGTCVTQLQNALSVRGIPSGRFGTDGKFGASTKAAVIEYQKLWGLTADGVVGPKTRASIAAHPKPHAKIIARLNSRWSESGTIVIVDKMGKRGSPAVSNVARVYVFKDAKLIRTIQARTGGKAWDKRIGKWVYKDTPTGAFRVWDKIAAGYSTFYDADMPWFTVFTTNIGFHGSEGFMDNGYGITGNYGSHGCVNMNPADARLIFNLLTKGRNQVLVQQTSTSRII